MRSASFALKLRFCPKTVSYAEYPPPARALTREKFLQIEGESAVLTTIQLRPSSVKSAGMSPYSANKIRINMIGTN